MSIHDEIDMAHYSNGPHRVLRSSQLLTDNTRLDAKVSTLAAELAKLREDYRECVAALEGMLTAFSLETDYNLKDSAVIRLEAKKSARAIISKAKGRAG